MGVVFVRRSMLADTWADHNFSTARSGTSVTAQARTAVGHPRFFTRRYGNGMVPVNARRRSGFQGSHVQGRLLRARDDTSVESRMGRTLQRRDVGIRVSSRRVSWCVRAGQPHLPDAARRLTRNVGPYPGHSNRCSLHRPDRARLDTAAQASRVAVPQSHRVAGMRRLGNGRSAGE